MHYDIVVHDHLTTAETADTHDVLELAKIKVNDEVDKSTVQPFGDGFALGNYKGLTLLESVDSLKRDVKRIDSEVKQLKAENQAKEEIVHENRQQIELLKQSSEGYLKIRKRYLDFYKRDILRINPTTSDILSGNAAAHHGDAVTDATLYSIHHRSDQEVYRQLYGFGYKTVLKLRKSYI